MTREEARKAAEVMMAYADGKMIEIYNKINKKWEYNIAPRFDWLSSDYRIKPEPTYRPFKDKGECWAEMQKHQPFGWLINKSEGYLYSLSYLYDETNFISFYEILTFADGTPFGIKED